MSDTVDNTLLTMGGLSSASGIPAITLKRWVRKGLLSCRRDTSGKRIFGPADLKVANDLRHRDSYWLKGPPVIDRRPKKNRG